MPARVFLNRFYAGGIDSRLGTAMDWMHRSPRNRQIVKGGFTVIVSALALAILAPTTDAQQGFRNPSQGMMQLPANTGQPAMSGGWQSTPDARVASTNTTVSSSPTAISSTTASTSSSGKIPLRNLLQIFHDGGILMYPIAICSFAMMVFFFERLIALRPGRVIPRPFVKRLIEQLEQQNIDRDEAIELCLRNPSPISQICSAALKRYGRPAVEVEQMVLDSGERVANQLRRYVRVFSAISNVSPLLGLLGTVLGMIESFNAISGANGMGKPEVLAGGISTALLTTAAGLVVAIPSYLMYMYFVARTDSLVMEMDRYAQQVVDTVSAEGLQESDGGRSRSRSRRAA
jgi:biopolymer transport protein ExbB